VGVQDQVINEIASAIHVRHVQTSLGAARTFTRGSHAGEVAAHMQEYQFDATPVFPDSMDRAGSAPLDPDGTLWRSELERLDSADEIRSAVRPLTGSTLIDGNASIGELLERFRNSHTFILVVGGRGLEGMVTPSDMNKQAGRTHLFMQVSALEMALSERLRAAGSPDQQVLDQLPRDRARQVKARLAKKQAVDDAADLVAALDMQDLLIIARAREDTTSVFALSDREIRSLTDFRNSVMHAVLEPAGDEGERFEDLLLQTALLSTLVDDLQRST
jgi:hypothetical protein